MEPQHDQEEPLVRSVPKSDAEMAHDPDHNRSFIVNVGDRVAKYSNQNKRFWRNLSLAFAIAGWMTLFGLPAYSSYVENIIFGLRFVEIDGHQVRMCEASMMGPWFNNGTAEKPNLIHYTRPAAENGIESDVWCGYIPGNFLTAWPGVVQTAMFTLYLSRGTTMKLAWQCIAGTACAVLNMVVMAWFFPMGSMSPNYSEIIAWVDLSVVIFLFLASRADVNTMMMGIRWTICLMMNFMDPNSGSTLGKAPSPIPGINYDAETTVVMVTSMLGTLIAILATSVPRPLSNIAHVHDDAKEIVKGVDAVLSDALAYYCQSAGNSKRFRICAKISALDATVKGVKDNLDDSFWETFDLGHYGRMRYLYGTFNNTLLKAQDVLYIIQISLTSLNFNDEHQRCVAAIRAPMFALKNETIACLNACLNCCKDGNISEQETQRIEDHVRQIEDELVRFCQWYQRAMLGNSMYISDKIAPDSLFVFSLANWCRVLQDWAADLSQFEQKQSTSMIYKRNPLGAALKEVAYMFDPRFMFEKENLRFTAISALPILGTFAIALYSKGSVFIQYSTTMPATLAMLVFYDYGSVFFKNLLKLTGVTFGKTLPLLLISVVELLPCGTPLRLVVHASSIFLFYVIFAFMYYASDKWSTIGRLVGGFGCFTLFVPCSGGRGVDYAGLYKAIAEVVIAVMLKMLVSSLLAPKEPRDLAIEALENTVHGAFFGLAHLFDNGPQDGGDQLDENIHKAKVLLTKCQDFGPKCDPLLQIAPGIRTPFKLGLYSTAVQQLRLVLADMDMLSVALKGHVVLHPIRLKLTSGQKAEELDRERAVANDEVEQCVHRHVSKLKAWDTIKQDVLNTMQLSFNMCIVILKHATEEPLESKAVEQLEAMSNLMSLDGLDEFYREVSHAAGFITKSEDAISKDQRIVTQIRRARFLVYINSLSLITEHSAHLAQECFKHMIYC